MPNKIYVEEIIGKMIEEEEQKLAKRELETLICYTIEKIKTNEQIVKNHKSAIEMSEKHIIEDKEQLKILQGIL